MRTLIVKAQPTHGFFATVNQLFRGSSQLPITAEHCFVSTHPPCCLNCAQRFDYRALGSGRKLGGTAEHLIDGSEKLLCQSSFEFQSPQVNESRSVAIPLQ